MHALHVLLLSAACECLSIGVLLLTQPNQYDLSKVLSLQKSVDLQSKHHNISVSVFKSHDSFGPINGHWTIFPLLERLLDEASVRDYGWLIICEPDSDINLLQLKDFLSRQDDNEALFFGYGLRDTSPTIIHHFYGFDSTEQMEYPDFAAGVAVSRVLLARLVDERKRLNSLSTDFAIDIKHEFAKFVFDCCRTRLHSVPDVFCLFPGSNCAIVYHQPTFSENELCKQSEVTVDNVFVAIKTYSGFHRSRVVAVKRTWASKFKFAEFVSDIEDHYIPTITLGVSNTQRGHCAKTLAIIKHYVNQNLINLSLDWLVIADDDTLLSPSRLMRLLRCFNKTEKLIIGERYGYGFSLDGTGGYDYPTGGAGMLFSLSAAQILAKQCSCPNQDSPDDMIIGSCARSFSIPVIHSAAFHQARSIDYSSDYVKRIVPISFHKFEEIDPYKEYMSNLHDEEQAADFRAHAEL